MTLVLFASLIAKLTLMLILGAKITLGSNHSSLRLLFCKNETFWDILLKSTVRTLRFKKVIVIATLYVLVKMHENAKKCQNEVFLRT